MARIEPKSKSAKRSTARSKPGGLGARDRAKRLGAAIKTIREERGLSAAVLAKQAGLSRSYLNYLETGKFAEVGLDKFSRIVAALGLSADQILREAGFLPAGADGLPDPKTFLATQYGLSPTSAEQALAFLEFLAAREKTRTPGQARPRSRRQDHSRTPKPQTATRKKP